jgi:hypothetical protein
MKVHRLVNDIFGIALSCACFTAHALSMGARWLRLRH